MSNSPRNPRTPRRLGELGEFGLIRRIQRAAARCAPSRSPLLLGIGDDAALLRLPARGALAMTTDAAVEGVHFRRETEAASTLGRRLVAATLSDLAAMGARPLAMCAAFAAPAELEVAWVDRWLAGLLRAARAYRCALAGGNLSQAGEISITLSAVGSLSAGRGMRRTGARPGDRLLVTGVLGRSALDRTRAARRGAPRRHVPPARLTAGVRLAALPSAGACIDISDGVLADLGHVLRASGVGAEIDPTRLPRPPRFASACRALGLHAERLLLEGGEDYELLFTVRRSAPPAAELSRQLGVAVSEIGTITARRGLRGARGQGFSHFTS